MYNLIDVHVLHYKSAGYSFVQKDRREAYRVYPIQYFYIDKIIDFIFLLCVYVFL